MPILEVIIPDNNHIICRKVAYETFKKIDPEDTSQDFHQVVTKNDPDYPEGCICKTNKMLVQETEIEGEEFSVLMKSQILFHILKENVQENLLKRR